MEVKGQRERRGRSLEFMMRLESRLRLSWSKFSFLLDDPSPSPSMSTRSLFTSESFRALRVTSAVFCFLMGGAREAPLCMPVATTTCGGGTAIIAGAEGAGAGATATADFFTFFFGDSEEMGTRLSSYNFLFTVLLI